MSFTIAEPIVEWFQRTGGRHLSHATINGVWCCKCAEYPGSPYVPSELTSTGHPTGLVCALCERTLRTLARQRA